MLSAFEAVSSRPISALAATVAAARAVNASAHTPASLFIVAMVVSYSVSAKWGAHSPHAGDRTNASVKRIKQFIHEPDMSMAQ
jgi:hypothetical protein